MRNKNKIAYIHIPRTAGTYSYSYLAGLLHRRRYEIKNSWAHMRRDWNKEELDSFIKEHGKLFVHNHSYGWDRETFYKYKKAGWFTICFIRHPGDRLCSEYFFWNLKDKWNISLNDFLKNRILSPLKGTSIPDYWRDIDYVGVFEYNNYRKFLSNYFNHLYVPKSPRLKSENKGYKYYCSKLVISKETQGLLLESRDYKIYSNVVGKTFQNKIKRKINKIIHKIRQPPLNNETVIKYLLYEYPIISQMMKRQEIGTVLENLKKVLDDGIDGEVVEFGCNQGTTSLFIRRLLDCQGSSKRFYVYDSFKGLPGKGKADKSNHPLNHNFKKGIVSVQEERLINNFKINNLELPIINKGWFKDIENKDLPNKIAFAFFDGDFYESIMDSFKKVYPRMAKGGIIVIDDYAWDALPGVKKACKDFLKGKPEKVYLKCGEGIMIKE